MTQDLLHIDSRIVSDQHLRLKMEKIYDEYSPVLYGFILKLTGEKEHAEQILQDTFYEINERLSASGEPVDFIKCAFKKTLLYFKEKGLSNPAPEVFRPLRFIAA